MLLTCVARLWHATSFELDVVNILITQHVTPRLSRGERRSVTFVHASVRKEIQLRVCVSECVSVGVYSSVMCQIWLV